MKILDRYILTEWGLAFLVAMFANTGLLIIEDIYKNVGDFVQAGVSFLSLVEYYSWVIVRVLPLVIPVSFFISLLFSLCKLHKNNEILAMRVIGKNIFQITSSLWVTSIFLTILSIGLNISISSYASRSTQDFCAGVKALSVRRNIAFDNIKDHRTWFLGRLDKKQNIGSNFMLCFYGPDGDELRRISARDFAYIDSHWLLYDGTETVFDPETAHPTRVEKFDTKKYDFPENPELFFSLKKRIKYLSLAELKNILSFSKNMRDYTDYRVQYYRSMVAPLSCILILFITIPFATVGVRRNPMAGVAKACEVLFLFYVVLNMFTVLGANGVVPLLVSVFAPYATILMFSYVLYRKCV